MDNNTKNEWARDAISNFDIPPAPEMKGVESSPPEKSKWEGFKDSLSYGWDKIKRDFDIRKDTAKTVFNNESAKEDDYEGVNPLKVYLNAMKGTVVPGAKAIMAGVTKTIDTPKDWKPYVDIVKEKVSKEAEKNQELTSQSTPMFHSDTKKKMNIISEYNWADDIVPIIEKAKIKDLTPRFSDDYNKVSLRDRHKASGEGEDASATAGRYFNKYDVIEEVLEGKNEEIPAHEMLHKLFRYEMAPAATNWRKFNEDWNSYIQSSDDELMQEMIKIDDTLMNSELYSHIPKHKLWKTLANERFAYLGEKIGRKDWDGEMPRPLMKYYDGIFNK